MADSNEAAKPGPMNEAELEAFLAGGEVCRATCLDDDGWPYSAPVWHEYSDGGFYLVGREESRWSHYMSRNPRASLCIDTVANPAKVLVQGSAEVIERPNIGGKWVAIARRMALRYLGPDGPKYLEPTMKDPRWLIFIRPRSLKSWRGSFSRLQ
ncbi:MAG: pyridoxamine 5'-phosphate oxidase family protein, partial [Alphaproteobacteria bacterium]|jgi:nitroimidazol reductase NimA-like FMN-containing flavoprotein (pyridoxamine 5'-phosphate oxidase superfamily)|nr:pyridoxamine 5'-phosphate oxidase family protein [Alphaproteobacteria bacterium]